MLGTFGDLEITVTIISRAATRDKYGDETVTTTQTVVPRVLFAARGSQERASMTQPTVYQAAALYFLAGLPDGVTLDSDDTITVAGVSPLVDGTYEVQGIPGYWGGPVEVAVTRTGGV